MKQSIFVARIQKAHRIWIPTGIREALNLKPGDKVEVIIRKVESKK